MLYFVERGASVDYLSYQQLIKNVNSEAERLTRNRWTGLNCLEIDGLIPREGKHYAHGHSACCTELIVQEVNFEISHSL